MGAGKIEVNTTHLAAGSVRSRDAADSARRAADALADSPVASGIFGDFDEAQQFHAKLSAAHKEHHDQLHGHHATLNGVSAKATKAAQAFAGTDESAASSIDSAAGDVE